MIGDAVYSPPYIYCFNISNSKVYERVRGFLVIKNCIFKLFLKFSLRYIKKHQEKNSQILQKKARKEQPKITKKTRKEQPNITKNNKKRTTKNLKKN